MCVFVSVCCGVSVDESKYSVAMASATVHWIFFFTARAGLGSSWVARKNNVFIERNSLPMDHMHRY